MTKSSRHVAKVVLRNSGHAQIFYFQFFEDNERTYHFLHNLKISSLFE
jgi:hypothetical protein